MSKSTLPLNEGQSAAAEGFFEFLLDPTQTELNISGPGGVGKTFTMAHMIDEIMPRYMNTCKVLGTKPLYNSVVMTATTNKAAEVLAQATNRPAETIHSYIGLTVRNNYKTGEADLIKSRSWSMKHNTVIFIDEASMIDRKLLKYIRDSTHQCKLIFVGDHCQLPPVKEKVAPIYNQQLPMYLLTQPMRTDIPELLAINSQLRDVVEGKADFGYIKSIPGIIDWVNDDEMVTLLNEHFAGTHTNSRILTFTNDQAVSYNEYIRGINGLSGEFTVGEELVSNSAVNIGANERLTIEQEVTVVDVDPEVCVDIVESSPDGTSDITLEYRKFSLDTGYGGIVDSVPVPTDIEYLNRLISYYAKQKNWERYFYLKERYPDLRAKHACTTHKSQGSTYDTVFIDLNDLSNCRQAGMMTNLMYVAFSRARKRVVLYGQLAEKYGQVIR